MAKSKNTPSVEVAKTVVPGVDGSDNSIPSDTAPTENSNKRGRLSKMERMSSTTADRGAVINDARIREQQREEHRTENERFYAGISALDTARRRETVLFGTVAGVEEMSIQGTEREREGANIVLSVLLDGKYRVIIPFDDIYQANPIDTKTVNLSTEEGRRIYLRRQRQMAGKLLGATIPFIITEMFSARVDGDIDYSIAGSRKKAIAIIANSNFRPARNGVALMGEGTVTDGVITSVGRHNISMNVGGVDVRVPLRNMTYKYVTDLRSLYNVGEIIKVVIERVELNDGPSGITLSVNARTLELESAKHRHHLLPAGTNCVGIVTSIRQSRTQPGKIVMTAYLPAYDMPAVIKSMLPSRYGKYPQSGDELGLVVTGFNDAGFVLTNCHRFHGAPGYLGR